jgi:hypothetical protein
VLLAFAAGNRLSHGEGPLHQRLAWDLLGRIPPDITIKILVLAELGPWGGEWGVYRWITMKILVLYRAGNMGLEVCVGC